MKKIINVILILFGIFLFCVNWFYGLFLVSKTYTSQTLNYGVFIFIIALVFAIGKLFFKRTETAKVFALSLATALSCFIFLPFILNAMFLEENGTEMVLRNVGSEEKTRTTYDSRKDRENKRFGREETYRLYYFEDDGYTFGSSEPTLRFTKKKGLFGWYYMDKKD